MSAELDDLDERMLALLPPVVAETSVEDYAEKLRELEDADPEPEEEEEPVPETGSILLTYTKAIVHRDEQGRIASISEANSRKFIERDVFGTVIAINEVTETEEVEEPEA